jgi:hypothetical protein
MHVLRSTAGRPLAITSICCDSNHLVGHKQNIQANHWWPATSTAGSRTSAGTLQGPASTHAEALPSLSCRRCQLLQHLMCRSRAWGPRGSPARNTQQHAQVVVSSELGSKSKSLISRFKDSRASLSSAGVNGRQVQAYPCQCYCIQYAPYGMHANAAVQHVNCNQATTMLWCCAC